MKTQADVDREFNDWFRKSFDATFDAAIEPLSMATDELADLCGAAIGNHQARISELIIVCKMLAKNDAYVSGCLDKIRKQMKTRFDDDDSEAATITDPNPISNDLRSNDPRSKSIDSVADLIEEVLRT